MFLRARSIKFQKAGLPESNRNYAAATSSELSGVKERGVTQHRTSGLAVRTKDGSLHFLHASSPKNYGRVIVDSRLSEYLYRYGSNSGILVARPLR